MELQPTTVQTVRDTWSGLAGLDPLAPHNAQVRVDPASALGPAGRLNVLVLDGAVAAAVPSVDIDVIVVDLLYADRSSFRAVSTTHAVEPVAADDPRLVDLVAAFPADEVNEAGAHELGQKGAIVAAADDGTLVAAAGYEVWGDGVAHCFVLTRPDRRNQQFGRAAASGAVARALDAGLVAQWRTRIPASRAIAVSLGFQPLGMQLCFRLTS